MEIFEKEYVSVSDTYLLPLTGLSKESEIPVKSFLFWKDYTIDNYQLILVYEYSDTKKLQDFLCTEVFPVLDREGYALETHDIDNKCIFILDISEWAFDIGLCLSGKYSKLSEEAKVKIQRFHRDEKKEVSKAIWVALFPNKAIEMFKNKTAIEYVATEYGLDLSLLQRVGELGSKYITMNETLLTDVSQLI